MPVLLRPWHGDSGHPISTAEALRAALPGLDYQLIGGFDDEPGLLDAFAALRNLCTGLTPSRSGV